MALPVWLSGIFSGGMSIVGEWVKGWQQRKMMKVHHKVKMAEIKITGAENRAMMDKSQEVAWDKAMSVGSMSSWKDEFWTIILAIPMVGCFIPKLAPHIMKGFEVLQTTPDWYKAAVGLAIGAAFGYRKFADWNMRKHLKTYATNGDGMAGPAPKGASVKRGFIDALKEEAKEVAEDIKEEFTDDE
jgi:hypothetical protein